ncbi:c-type cytochrome [Aromatoleum petrolei]|uniref:Cytochrome c domain-containing protein n=1 Tax=Aromatoleum petrolei TaxID=76116 RepID=A0ABX1MVQ3_9RHOO|nr:hypothetical protein [Aromatoleum petrolei]NMF91330.1 hypothetical protein [Aromatoleum petrolei]QTQ34429.1 Putative Cytochrome c4-like protein [Aromatoleum petrolei]
MRTHIVAVAFSALFTSTVFAATPDVQSLTTPCAECHGPAGVSGAPKTPHLNGQLADYLEQEIAGLANGDRATGVANHVPKTWSAANIAAVAQFYAQSTGQRPAQAVDSQKVAQGQGIHNKRCSECHPDAGRQSDHDAPLMAGQDLDYLIEQTKAFVSGKRKFVFLMDDAFRGLTADELAAVAHFFASQDQYKK